VADQHSASVWVQIGLGERERLADPQPGAPQHDDDPAQTQTIGSLARGVYHGADLLDGRWVGRVMQSLVPWRAALMEARERGRRATPPCPIQQR
jgi:hypothetical protein